MAVRKEEIRVDISGADKGARDLDKLGKSADKASDEIGDLGKSFAPYVAGATKAESATRKLDGEIEKLEDSIRDLGAEFAESGDKGVLAKLRDTRREVSNLQRIRKELDGIRKVVGGGGGGSGGGGSGGGVAGAAGSAIPGINGIMQLISGGGGIGSIALRAPQLTAAVGAPVIAGAGGLGLAAAGAGVLGAGIAGASKDENVQAFFSELLGDVAKDFKKASSVFAAPLIESASIFGSAWRDVLDDIQRMFGKLAGSGIIESFSKGISGFAKNVMPGLERAVEASIPVLDMIADQLPELGDTLSDFFDSLADAGPGASKALLVLMETFEGFINIVGEVIEATAKGYDWITKLFGIEAKPETAEALDNVAVGANSLAEMSRKAADEVGALNDEFDKLFGRAIDAEEALLNYEAAIDGLTESFKENGRTIDAGTEKGRANREAIKSIIEALEQQRDAAIATGDGTKASYDKANAAFLAGLENLRRMLQMLGLTKEQIDGILSGFEQMARPITKVVTVQVVQRGAGSAGNREPSRSGRPGTVEFFAAGGDYKAGVPRVVGEKGPELDIPKTPGTVIPADLTRRLRTMGGGGSPLATATGGGNLTVQLVSSGNGGDAIRSLIAEWIRKGALKLVVANGRVAVG